MIGDILICMYVLYQNSENQIVNHIALSRVTLGTRSAMKGPEQLII